MLCLGAAGQGTARQREGGDCAVGTYQRWSPEVEEEGGGVKLVVRVWA